MGYKLCKKESIILNFYKKYNINDSLLHFVIINISVFSWFENILRILEDFVEYKKNYEILDYRNYKALNDILWFLVAIRLQILNAILKSNWDKLVYFIQIMNHKTVIFGTTIRLLILYISFYTLFFKHLGENSAQFILISSKFVKKEATSNKNIKKRTPELSIESKLW